MIRNIVYVIDCVSLSQQNLNGGALDNPKGANHSSNNEQVRLYVDGVMQPDAETPVNIAQDDTLHFTAVNRSDQDQYKCVIVRFTALYWTPKGGSQVEATPTLMNNQDQRPISIPTFDSQAQNVYGVHYTSSETSPSWTPDALDIDGRKGSQITNDAQPKSGALRVPYIEIEPQNPGLLQYRVEFMWACNGVVQGYNTFD
ncbi:MAG: hypothetical protein ACMG6S_26195, partial [Byssovorax sp.]